MNRKRLFLLIRKLRSLKPNQFDIELWKQQKSCGTVYCAGGWACMIPSFKRDGLYLGNCSGLPLYNNSSGFEALANFFEISNQDSIRLFHWSYYHKDNVRAKDVIAKINILLEQGTLS